MIYDEELSRCERITGILCAMRAIIESDAARLKVYHEIANKYLGPTSVSICSIENDPVLGTPVRGIIERFEEGYRIRLAPGMKPGQEQSVYTHEVAHGLLGHLSDISRPIDAHKVKAMLNSPLVTEAKIAGIDLIKIYKDKMKEREDKTDDLARILHPFLFNGEVYDPDGINS